MLLPSAHRVGFWAIQVVGAGVMTLQYQDSLDDGVTYFAIRTRPASTLAADTTDIVAAGLFVLLSTMIPQKPRVAVSAYTSGSFTVYAKWVAAQRAMLGAGPSRAVFTGAGQILPLPSAESEVYTIQLVGAGVMTIQLQDSYDGGTTFFPLNVANLATGVANKDITAAGIFGQASVAALIQPRLIVTAFTSGQMAVAAVLTGRSIV